MFTTENATKKTNLVIVCEDKDMQYANYLIQLIGENDDDKDSHAVIGVKDDSVSAAIWSPKHYKDNLPTLTSRTHIVFLGLTDVAKEQVFGISNMVDLHGLHYGWLGKRAVMYIDNEAATWFDPKTENAKYSSFLCYCKDNLDLAFEDAFEPLNRKININLFALKIDTQASVFFWERDNAVNTIKKQQMKALVYSFYMKALSTFVEG